MKHPLRKPTLVFFRKIQSLQFALMKATDSKDVWPFANSREIDPDKCFLKRVPEKF